MTALWRIVRASYAEKNINQQNELLKVQHGSKTMDTKAAKQSEKIRQWQPWASSTGPRTGKGKAASSRNAYKGGEGSLLLRMSRLLREQSDALKLV